MQEIEKLRGEIDQIHDEIAQLFRRRLRLTQKIWQIKQKNQYSFIDQNRETEIIHRYDNAITDIEEKKAVQSFFKNLLLVSREYLKVEFK